MGTESGNRGRDQLPENSIQTGRCNKFRSRLRVEQTPSHGADLIESVHRFTGPGPADRPSVSEEIQVAVNLLLLMLNDPEVPFSKAANATDCCH